MREVGAGRPALALNLYAPLVHESHLHVVVLGEGRRSRDPLRRVTELFVEAGRHTAAPRMDDE